MISLDKHYIAGEFVDPIEKRMLEIINPSTESVIGEVALGAAADVDRAVKAAREAFPAFASSAPEERRQLLENLLGSYRARAEDLAQAISKEMGAPIDYAREQQVPAGEWHLEGFIEALETFPWEEPAENGERLFREPIGLVGMITPWNWPMNQITLKVGAAIAAGCASVLKPSEISPISGSVFAEIVQEAGIPAGVFNLVHGDGEGVGRALAQHPEIDVVSFTGSTRAGISISRDAAESMKRVSLELGGKGANLIFADADKGAARKGARRVFNNSGQSCNAPTRMLVERSRYEAAVQEAQAAAEATQISLSADAGNHIGPVVSAQQWERIQGLIRSGIEEGARLVAGGEGRPEGLEAGYFVRPTVFADVTPVMRIVREEIFGPVVVIQPFDSEEEAIHMANDTEYGLTNYIQTSDPERARRIARQLRSGMVEMNGRGFIKGSPFGGYQKSGNGREGGRLGIEEFLEVKAVSGWEEA